MIPDPNNHNPDGIIEDEKSLAIKAKVMERLKVKNAYDATSKVAMFAGTMLTTATMASVLGGLFHGGGVAALVGAISNPAIAIALAVGAAIIGVAVAADYIGSYMGQGANFDIQEVAANSTARHLRTELEAANLAVPAQPRTPPAQDTQKNWAAQAEAEKSKLQETAPQRS
jgi:hypothetical protein